MDCKPADMQAKSTEDDWNSTLQAVWYTLGLCFIIILDYGV